MPCSATHLSVLGCLVRRVPKEIEKGANDVAVEQYLPISSLYLASTIRSAHFMHHPGEATVADGVNGRARGDTAQGPFASARAHYLRLPAALDAARHSLRRVWLGCFLAGRHACRHGTPRGCLGTLLITSFDMCKMYV